MLRLEERLYVVTGATGGIGQAVTTMIAENGGRVIMTDLNSAQGESVAKKIASQTKSDIFFRHLDVCDSNAVTRLADSIENEVGAVHGLVTAAGIGSPCAAIDYSVEEWRRTFAVNVEGTFFPIQAFARHMQGREASIVTISSICASIVVSPERHLAYGASKAAVKHLTALLGVEWAGSGIRVNSVAPNHTDTPILTKFKDNEPEIYRQWEKKIPIGRLSRPHEIAGAVVFLLSDLSSNIVGETIYSDGGCSKSF